LSCIVCNVYIYCRYIGCSDSRVPANQILGLGPGEVFVHRNVGNQVIGSDMNCTSAIEFAVKFLNVKHIIVAGHYDCGAVHASMKRQDLGLLENWIRSIRDVYRIHQQAMSLIECPDLRHKRLVELNVIEQCLNVYKTGAVQSKRMACIQRGEDLAFPRVHAMVFDPKVGLLRKLPVNFRKTVSQFKDIYDLY
jgi:carbonic anhydrase